MAELSGGKPPNKVRTGGEDEGDGGVMHIGFNTPFYMEGLSRGQAVYMGRLSSEILTRPFTWRDQAEVRQFTWGD